MCKNLNRNYYNPSFSHIYVEKGILRHHRAKQILERLGCQNVVEIQHYKDVFCRSRQNYTLQSQAQSLILAEKKERFLYLGTPICQNFGNEAFYYTSCVMNCVYRCEYCYLKGMYPSGHMVIFVNLEDLFWEIKQTLRGQSAYLCVSYDTDLLALEPLLGYGKAWTLFAKEQEQITVEIRTKSANPACFDKMEPLPNVAFAFTLSPQEVIDAYEHGAPSLQRRIKTIRFLQNKGFVVRLCFDPMIYHPNWKLHYENMLRQIFSEIRPDRVKDASIGVFRIAGDYLKKMRKQEPYSAIAQFPYENEGGVRRYPAELTRQMEEFLWTRLKEKIEEETIFVWRGN